MNNFDIHNIDLVNSCYGNSPLVSKDELEVIQDNALASDAVDKKIESLFRAVLTMTASK